MILNELLLSLKILSFAPLSWLLKLSMDFFFFNFDIFFFNFKMSVWFFLFSFLFSFLIFLWFYAIELSILFFLFSRSPFAVCLRGTGVDTEFGYMESVIVRVD